LGSVFQFKNKPAYLISLYLLACTAVVLVCEAASLLQQMNRACFLWAHSLLGPFQGLRIGKENLLTWLNSPDLVIFGIVAGLAYLVGAALIFLTPQNNFDSMTYHLSRVGYWLQHDSLFPWITPNPRQTSFPINAELSILWMVIFWGTDQLSGFVQWVTVPVIGLVIVGFARLLGASRKQSLFAALIWACFPEIILQSITTMNDLVVAAFYSSAVYLGFLGVRQKEHNLLLLAGLGIGLALGTKSTAFILSPSFVLAAGLILLSNWNRNFKFILTWGLASLAAFIMVGAWGYVQNAIYYHNPFSVPQWTEGLVNPPVSRAQLFSENSLLYLNQAIDWTGAPPIIYQPLAGLQARVMQKLVSSTPAAQESWLIKGKQYLNFILYSTKSIHEDLAWFGPLFLILYIPTCAYHLIVSLKRKDTTRLGLAMLSIGFGLTMCLMISWTPYKGRYFALVVPFCAPFMAVLFQPAKRWLFLRWLITGASLFILCRTLLLNQSKPLVGENSVWGLDTLTIQTFNNPGMEPVLRMVESYVPTESSLATKLSVNTWDYPLFGKGFERRIIQADPFALAISPSWLAEQAADFLLVEPKERFALGVPAGLELIDQVNGWTLYRLCQQSTCPTQAEIADQLLGSHDRENLLTIAPELTGQVGVLELRSGGWGIEQLDGNGIFWLGEGGLHGLTGYLWSERKQSVQIRVEVEPGPSKADPLRTLQFSLFWAKGYDYAKEGRIIDEKQFDQAATLTFSALLNQGLNEFRLSSRDLAEFRSFANGDTRPLLILTRHIDVESNP
jgi:4-amino-4-deoxy-L-arabinose transferase-like glycosyltransferase